MSFLFLILMVFLSSRSNAHHTLYVGWGEGWTLHPSENYNHWAERNRFEINDTLVFVYEKGHDSVLVVNRNDYSKCNKKNPIRGLEDGHSLFKFEKSGHFFFISGHDQNCEKGQKLHIVVLSPHHNHHKTPSSSTPTPATSPINNQPSYPVEPLAHSPSPSSTSDFHISLAQLVQSCLVTITIYVVTSFR